MAYLSGRTALTTVLTADIADDAVTLAKMAGGTDGNLIGIDANGDPAYIATGTDGQVLTSGGANVAALMETAAGGGLETFITTNAPSGAATTAFTTGFGTYDYIDFTFINMQGSSSGANLQMETSTDGGSAYRSSAYRYGGLYQTSGSGGFSTVPSSTSGSKILMMRTELDIDPTTEPGIEGTVRLFDPSSANQHQGSYTLMMTQPGAGDMTIFLGGFVIDAAENIDAVRFSLSSGNMTGDVHMTGVTYE